MNAPDVIVVGAGGGGPVLAHGLAERGVKVLMLEAGPWFSDLDHDFTKLEDDMFSFVRAPSGGDPGIGPSARGSAGGRASA